MTAVPMTQKPTQRKYVMTKIGPGDYLLPSNDAETIYRIRRYEDGPSQGLDWERDKEVWGVWRWLGLADAKGIDLDDQDRWEMVDANCRTRAEAVDEALSFEAWLGRKPR